MTKNAHSAKKNVTQFSILCKTFDEKEWGKEVCNSDFQLVGKIFVRIRIQNWVGHYFYFMMLFKWYKLITVCSLSHLILNEWDPHHALNCETRLGAALANRVSIHHVCTMYSAYMKMDAMVLENQILSISNMIYNS